MNARSSLTSFGRWMACGLLAAAMGAAPAGAQTLAPPSPNHLSSAQTPSADILPEQPASRQAATSSDGELRAADMGLSLVRRYESRGLTVTDIDRRSALARAGLRLSDQVVSINGQPMTSEAKFVQAMLAAGTGNQPANVIVLRGGQQQSLSIDPAAVRQAVFAADPLFQAGLLVDERRPHRLVITRVLPGTPAYEAGLMPGDIISQIGSSPVANLATLRRAVEEAGGNNVMLEVRRGASSRLATVAGIDTSLMRTAMRSGIVPGTEGGTLQRR